MLSDKNPPYSHERDGARNMENMKNKKSILGFKCSPATFNGFYARIVDGRGMFGYGMPFQ